MRRARMCGELKRITEGGAEFQQAKNRNIISRELQKINYPVIYTGHVLGTIARPAHDGTQSDRPTVNAQLLGFYF